MNLKHQSGVGHRNKNQVTHKGNAVCVFVFSWAQSPDIREIALVGKEGQWKIDTPQISTLKLTCIAEEQQKSQNSFEKCLTQLSRFPKQSLTVGVLTVLVKGP